jgi:hypothetical protein
MSQEQKGSKGVIKPLSFPGDHFIILEIRMRDQFTNEVLNDGQIR